MESSESLQPTNVWDEFFNKHPGLIERNRIGYYGYEEIIRSKSGIYIKRTTETGNNSGRERIEIKPVIVNGRLVCGSAGVITKYGTQEEGKKEPVGHTFTTEAERWNHQQLSDELIRLSAEPEGWESTVQEPNNNGQVFIKETKTLENGKITRHSILEGPGKGRIWSVFTPYEPDIIDFVISESEAYQLAVQLSYGITIEQGDTSDKSRSETGSTHYAVAGINLIEN
ncbi:MAG: hypothetical protein QG570_523 [Patescibacteria group bacterium]|nr:hypothetical protein [Patescibacteria group bacterium]